MPQTMFVKVKTAAGEEAMREVKILRTFSHATKGQIFQHTNGVFGYKDGAPVRTEEELDIITHPLHRKAAQLWWERIGRKMSEKYYAAQLERERARLGDYQPTDGADNTEMDAKLYYRQPVNSAAEEDVEGPFSWMDIFSKRPDWWGQARAIQFMDYQYVLEEAFEQFFGDSAGAPAADQPPEQPDTPPPGQTTTPPGDDNAAEIAEEKERQELMAQIKEEFPTATIHPATGLRKLKEKYLELKAEAEAAAEREADDSGKEAQEFE